MPSDTSRVFPLGFLPAVGWKVRDSGARVKSYAAEYVVGEQQGTVVYERVNGVWGGYGLTPSPTLDLDYADDASRLLLWQYLGDRLHGQSRGTVVASGVAITESKGLVSYYDLQPGETEEARVYATLVWLARGARPVRRGPRQARVV